MSIRSHSTVSVASFEPPRCPTESSACVVPPADARFFRCPSSRERLRRALIVLRALHFRPTHPQDPHPQPPRSPCAVAWCKDLTKHHRRLSEATSQPTLRPPLSRCHRTRHGRLPLSRPPCSAHPCQPIIHQLRLQIWHGGAASVSRRFPAHPPSPSLNSPRRSLKPQL